MTKSKMTKEEQLKKVRQEIIEASNKTWYERGKQEAKKEFLEFLKEVQDYLLNKFFKKKLNRIGLAEMIRKKIAELEMGK